MAELSAEKPEVEKKKRTRRTSTALNFNLNLKPEESAALDEMLLRSNRSRQNFGETLVVMALRAHSNGEHHIDLRALGSIPLPGKLASVSSSLKEIPVEE